MDKDIPDVIAHPDLFMQARNSFGEKEEEVTRAICRKAIEKGIPLEINFGKIASKIDSNLPIEELKEKIPYPAPEFWNIVADETQNAKENGKDLIVIYGKDAHFPGQLSIEKDYEIAKEIIGEEILDKLHLVTSYEELENGTKPINVQKLAKTFAKDNTVALMKENAQTAFQQLEMEQEQTPKSKSLSD